MRFYDRNNELNLLKKTTSLAQNSAQMTVITGRRRVGKTELVVNYLNEIKNGAYFFVTRKKLEVLAQEFNDELKELNPNLIGESQSFEVFLKNLFETSLSAPVVAVFDEFQNFKYIDPSVFSIFQKFWDQYFKKAKIHLIFIGSMVSMMEKIFSDRKEPLFGRATAKIDIPPFSPFTLVEILKDWGSFSPQRLLDFYTVFGGIPKYYAVTDSHSLQTSAIEDNLRELVLNKSGILYKEVYGMLIEEFGKKYQTYFTVLQAISSGKSAISEIANACGLTVSSASKYVNELLTYYKLIERWVPFGSKRLVSKMGLYFMSDEFTKFWFRYVYRYESLIELKREKDVISYVKADLNNLRGFAFERLMKAVLIELNAKDLSPFRFEKIGRYWDRKGDVEIDILLQNGAVFLFGECKLSAKSIDNAAIDNFLNKIKLVSKSIRAGDAVPAFFTLEKPPADIFARLESRNIKIYSLDELIQGT